MNTEERREALVEAIGTIGYRLVGALVESWIAEARAAERRKVLAEFQERLLAEARADREEAGGGPRCQHVSPSPWGSTQCALPDGHDGRHAYSSSETRDDT